MGHTDLSRWTAEDIEAVAHALNTRPRKTLGWKTPAEAFNSRTSYSCSNKPVLRQPIESALRAAVRMNHRTNGFAAQPDHVQGVGDQLRTQMIGDRTTHHAAGEHIEDDRGVDPALTRAVLGDVGDPQPVRALGDESAVDQVRL